MRSVVIREILAKVDALPITDDAKRQVNEVAQSVAFAHGLTRIDRSERVGFARALLDFGAPRTEIRDRLMARHSISRREAYRVIEAALQLCQKPPGFWHRSGE